MGIGVGNVCVGKTSMGPAVTEIVRDFDVDLALVGGGCRLNLFALHYELVHIKKANINSDLDFLILKHLKQLLMLKYQNRDPDHRQFTVVNPSILITHQSYWLFAEKITLQVINQIK
ncbi:hypothetical protein ALC53_11811 [Atta colombica]|uniref:Uncharacterized protein n=1 Tax=Atta colombica TaxID=520822 RepID=A0A195B0I3_9HYME|nr:hypothetical protein ALC53_11811 [Atta colombica]